MPVSRIPAHVVRLLTLGTALALLAGAARAEVASGPTIPRPVGERLSSATRTVTAIRAAAATGNLADLLSTAMRSGAPVPIRAPARGFAPATIPGREGLPSGLATSIEDLQAAVRLASATVGEALAGVKPEVRLRTLRSLRVSGWAGHAAAAPVTRDVPMERIRGAAHLLAKTLDRQLPALLVAAAGYEAPASAGEAACDVIDLLPALCVGGVGANVFTRDAALLVDLGGNDRYENSAGGASGLTGGLPASVNVDLAGDDVYDQQIGSGELLAGQGASFYGVGMLVDVAGNDSYLRRYRREDNAGVLQMAQGSSAAGVGLLADLDGTDSYTVRVADDVVSYYQGAGDGYGSTGVLFDGGGDDAYLLDGGTIASEPDGTFVPASRQVYGQGYGLFGVGAVVDLRGSDSFTATGRIETPLETTSYEGMGAFPTQAVVAQAIGQLGGTGLLLTGDGPTTYSATASTAGLGLHFVHAQGHSSDAATAVLDDRGGHDTYEISSRMVARAEAAGGAGCGCGTVRASVDPSRLGNPQNVSGQGNSGSYFFGNASALGLLSDHGGNDRYLVEEESMVEAMATATDGVGAVASAEAFSAGPVWVQGTAHAFGLGALVDQSGDDVYDVRLEQLAVAEANASGGAERLAVADAQQPEVQSFDPPTILAQGGSGWDASAGALIDLDGRDSYRAVTRSRAIAEPTLHLAFEQRTDGSVQGSGPDAFFLDQDGGEPDTFVAEPNFEAVCQGNRGEPSQWTECPDVRANWIASSSGARPLGRGFVDSAPVKGVPSIVIGSVEPHASGQALVVRGSLAAPGGAALADRFVDVRLNRTDAWAGLGSAAGIDTRVVQVAASHAFTTADGSWTSVIQLPEDIEASDLTLWTGFSGDQSLRAAVAQVDL